MSGNTNFPTGLDDDSSLGDVTDTVSALQASDHNNLKEAVKALEAKVGIFSSAAPTTLDYRLGNPTNSHNHDGATGRGMKISPSSIDMPSGVYPTGTLHDYLLNNPGEQIVTLFRPATAIIGSNVGAPVIIGRTMQLVSMQGALRRGPSGATTAFDVNLNQPGPTSVYWASQGFRPIFPPGATAYRSSATPNTITYPSGAVITVDVDTVGSNEPGQDLTLTLVFRT